MRIDRIILRNFRGVQEADVEFGSGVTIVAGPNEVGKSSIAEAIRLVRTMKHSSRAAQIRALQPVGRDVGPEVQLWFSSGGHEVWVRKQWLRDASTELHISGASREQLSGDEAHDRLGEFLAAEIDVDLFDALEITQGGSLERAELVGLRSLTKALDDSSAPVADHDDLLERIEAEYSLHFTATGRPRGRYQQVAADIADHRDDLETAVEAAREMDRFTDDVEREHRQLAADEADLVAAQENLTEASARDSALTELRDGLARADQAAEASGAALAHAQAAREARRVLAAELAERQEALAVAMDKVAAFEEELGGLTESGASLIETRDGAREALTAARSQVSAATSAVERAVDRQNLEALTARLTDAQAAEERRMEASRILGTCHVDGALLERITSAGADLQVARAAQESASARVRIHPLGEGPLEVDGQPVTDGQEILATRALTIEVPGVARIEVQPGTLPEDLHQAVQHAQDALDTLLGQGQVATIEEARTVAAARADAEQDRRLAVQALAAALAEDTLADLQDERAIVQDRLAGASQEETEDLATLRGAAAVAGEMVLAAEEALSRTQERVGEHETRVGEARIALARAEADRDNLASAVERAAAALVAAREASSDEDLEASVHRAQELSDTTSAHHQEAQAALAAANPEAVEMELANAKEWASNAGGRVAGTRLRLEKVKALLEDRAKQGLYDRIADLRTALAEKEREYSALERRAGAIALLREVMVRHRDEAHARYVTPFAERIRRLGRIVFGSDFDVTITPELQISHRTLDGQTVPFESLSAGAREQLGLLGRLAAAALVDPGEGAPLILDDTLGYADDQRLTSLAAVVNDVGKTTQIIVLTCQPGRFSRVGGATMVHLPSTLG